MHVLLLFTKWLKLRFWASYWKSLGILNALFSGRWKALISHNKWALRYLNPYGSTTGIMSSCIKSPLQSHMSESLDPLLNVSWIDFFCRSTCGMHLKWIGLRRQSYFMYRHCTSCLHATLHVHCVSKVCCQTLAIFMAIFKILPLWEKRGAENEGVEMYEWKIQKR